jgi:hypothetical protein
MQEMASNMSGVLAGYDRADMLRLRATIDKERVRFGQRYLWLLRHEREAPENERNTLAAKARAAELEAARTEFEDAYAKWCIRRLLTVGSPDALLSEAATLEIRKRLLGRLRDGARRQSGARRIMHLNATTKAGVDRLAEAWGLPSRGAVVAALIQNAVEGGGKRLAPTKSSVPDAADDKHRRSRIEGLIAAWDMREDWAKSSEP